MQGGGGHARICRHCAVESWRRQKFGHQNWGVRIAPPEPSPLDPHLVGVGPVAGRGRDVGGIMSIVDPGRKGRERGEVAERRFREKNKGEKRIARMP